jgi:hypothetical protein
MTLSFPNAEWPTAKDFGLLLNQTDLVRASREREIVLDRIVLPPADRTKLVITKRFGLRKKATGGAGVERLHAT